MTPQHLDDKNMSLQIHIRNTHFLPFKRTFKNRDRLLRTPSDEIRSAPSQPSVKIPFSHISPLHRRWTVENRPNLILLYWVKGTPPRLQQIGFHQLQPFAPNACRLPSLGTWRYRGSGEVAFGWSPSSAMMFPRSPTSVTVHSVPLLVLLTGNSLGRFS